MSGRLAWLIALLLLLGACQSPSAPSFAPPTKPTSVPSLSTPAALPTTAPRSAVPTGRSRVSTAEGNYRIEIAVFDANGRTAITSDIGTTVRLTIAFRPSKDVVTQWSDGTLSTYSEGWLPGPGTQMRYCAAVDRQCTLPDQWVDFEKEQHTDLTVAWVGLRSLGVVAQFRDANGKTIPAGYSKEDTATTDIPISGIVNEKTPVAAQPPAIQTAIAHANTAFPVSGSVEVGQGSAIGGKAGTSINIPVKFQATSPSGPVKDMRIKQRSMGGCLAPDEIADAPWEPFVPLKTFSYRVALNWTTFKVHVQYRDAQGNFSPVYCDDIAVEGQP